MAMKIFNVGDVLGAADVNEYLVNTRVGVKPADTSRTSNAVLTADPDMVVTADASKTYEMLVTAVFNGPTAGGFQCNMICPNSTTFTGLGWELNGSTGLFVGGTVFQGLASGFLLAPQHLTTVTGSDMAWTYSGTLTTAGSGGLVTFRWAQDTSNATSTILRAGSALRLKRIA